MHLGKASIGYLQQKVGHHGRHQRRASKEERKYLKKVATTSTSILCTNLASCIYEEKTPE